MNETKRVPLACKQIILMNFKTIQKGNYSGIQGAENHVFRTGSSFELFWKRHVARTHSPPTIPIIDFRTCMIVCVMRGEQCSGGYGIEIDSITPTIMDSKSSSITVRSKLTTPGNDCLTTQALTQPFHLVQTKAWPPADQHDGVVQFETIAATPNPPRYPVFILSFDEEKVLDPLSTAANITTAHDPVRTVEVLKGVKLFFVHFHEHKIDPWSAKKLILDKIVGTIKHVDYLEADPLEEYWSSLQTYDTTTTMCTTQQRN